METLLNLDWEAVLLIVTGAVTIASGIAAITPNKVDDSIVAKLRSFVNILALNVGNAKPEQKKEEKDA